jgi:hypothetical protein
VLGVGFGCRGLLELGEVGGFREWLGGGRPTVGGEWRRAVRRGIAGARPPAGGSRRRSANVGGRGLDEEDG